MPKEIIHDRDHGYLPRVIGPDGEWVETDPAHVGPAPAFVEVGWGRDSQHCQIATRAGGDYDEAVTPRPGMYVQLDRGGINRLIRTLRKARDAAYGSDA